MTATRKRETLTSRFADEENYNLMGVEEGYSQYIDRDQAVDHNGVAAYREYALQHKTTGKKYRVTPRVMERIVNNIQGGM